MIRKTSPGTPVLRAGLLVALAALAVAATSRAEDSARGSTLMAARSRVEIKKRSRTRTPTRTATQTAILTRAPTKTPTRLSTNTPAPLPTNTPPLVPTNTPPRTPTRAATSTPVRTPTSTPVRTPTQSSGQINLISLHDRTSSHYNRRCTQCHADVLTEESLNPSIASIHVVMRPYAAGEGDTQCAWCHRTVDLVQGVQSATKSQAALRKLVDPALCSVCHLPGGPATQLYQTGPSRTNPDGAQLYGLVCQPCHGELARSEVRGESASEIWSHINENEGGMGPLGVLSTQQIQAIADALAQ